MESLSSTDKQTALHILDRIEEAINTVQIRNSVIRNADDFLLTAEGREKLDAACMVIEAIGESFKNLDKLTKFDLLPLYPSIEWKEVKGVRDVIAHHYFDIDANEIFSIINNDFDSLKDAVVPQTRRTLFATPFPAPVITAIIGDLLSIYLINTFS